MNPESPESLNRVYIGTMSLSESDTVAQLSLA